MSALLRLNPFKCIKLNITTNVFRNRCISTSKSYAQQQKLRSSQGVERMLLRKDKLPESFQLVYRAPLESYVTWTKNVSTVTVTIIGLLTGYQLATQMNYLALTSRFDLGGLVSHDEDMWYYLAGFVLINLAIRFFVAKYPLRIYKSADKCSYVAVFESQLPVGTVKHPFQRGEVHEYRNVLNPWSHIMYRLGNRSSLLLIDYFKTPYEFHQLFQEKESDT